MFDARAAEGPARGGRTSSPSTRWTTEKPAPPFQLPLNSYLEFNEFICGPRKGLRPRCARGARVDDGTVGGGGGRACSEPLHRRRRRPSLVRQRRGAGGDSLRRRENAPGPVTRPAILMLRRRPSDPQTGAVQGSDGPSRPMLPRRRERPAPASDARGLLQMQRFVGYCCVRHFGYEKKTKGSDGLKNQKW